MSGTLIFAFLGGSIARVLSLMSYGIQRNHLLSSNFFILELARGILVTSVIVLMVPISAYISASIYKGSRARKFKLFKD